MVRLIIKKKEQNYTLDLDENPAIMYFKKAQDLATVEFVSSSYTLDFKLPKTKHNEEVLDLLSFVGDQSRAPYEKIRGDLYYGNHTIIRDGIVNIISSDAAHTTIQMQATTVDFSNAFRNKTFGKEVDLSALNHIKNLETVVQSHDDDSPYCYILADYNGNTSYKKENDKNVNILNIDYLVPSVRMSYLLDRLFETIGFTYSGDFFKTKEWKDQYITFPTSNNLAAKGSGGILVDQTQKEPKHIQWKKDDKGREFFYIQFSKKKRERK